jgi:oligosaccharide repeat unit polymerase
MSTTKRVSPQQRGLVAETGLLCAFVLISCGVIILGILSQEQAAWATLICLLLVLFAAWKRFDRGMHLGFLFLIFLFLFQAGRLVAYVLQENPWPFLITYSSVPFDVSDATSRMVMVVVISAALSVYVTCVLLYKGSDSAAKQRRREPNWVKWISIVFWVSVPFHLYKTIDYFLFTRDNGGYIAIYTSGGEHLASPLVRILSQVCFATFIMIFVAHRKDKNFWAATMVMAAATVIELFTGLRGKALLMFVCFYFFYKLKKATGFGLVESVVLVSAITFVALATAIFRENLDRGLGGIVEFVNGQGISMHVTALAVELQNDFAPNALSYLINQITLPFVPADPTTLGRLFVVDYATMLNPTALRNGFALGSTYLADAYLLGGLIAVVIVSVLVGLVLHFLNEMLLSSSVLKAAIALSAATTILYLPRAGLVESFVSTLRTGLLIVAIMILCQYLARIRIHMKTDSLNNDLESVVS